MSPATAADPPARLTHVGAGDPIPGISQAVIAEHGRIAYLSGHLPLGADGAIPRDFAGQLAQVFATIEATLHRLGAGAEDLLRLTIYVVGLSADKIPLIRAARDRLIGVGTTPPASALLGVAALYHPDVQVEVDAIVSLPSHSDVREYP